MSLNLHHLRIFVAVAEQGGFSRAAARLRLSQPAVSKSVRELEHAIGALLIERARGDTRLTDAGRALLARGQELFAVERSAEEDLRALRGLERGILRIAASTTIATYLLPRYVARFLAAYPKVDVRITSANTRDVARAMLGRRVDVALVEGPVHDERLEVVRWRDDALVVIAPPAHRLAHKRHVSVADLQGEPFIVRERGSGTRRVADDALARHGVATSVRLELSSTEAIRQAVTAGIGLAIISRTAIVDQAELERIAVLKVRGLQLTRDFSELRHVGRTPSAATMAFRATLLTS